MAGRRAKSGMTSERGAALLELSLVVSLLFMLLFGIIEFGYIMSFRGSMAQSAAEGARAAATAHRPLSNPALYDNSKVLLAAEDATKQAVGGFDQTCNSGGLTCEWNIHDCDAAPGTNDPADVNPNDCMTVTLTYDWDNHPILPDLPLISAAIPETLEAESVVELNE